MKIERSFRSIDRYEFDFKLPKHFAQLDTAQDAWYYGTWASPKQLQMVNYAEGDITVKAAVAVFEFVQMMRDWHSWALGNSTSFKPGIDPGLNQDRIQEWRDIGLADLLH